MRTNDKLNAFLNGAGFYIVLLVTIAVIAASGYFIYTTVWGGEKAEPATDSEISLTEQPEHDPSANTTEELSMEQDEPEPSQSVSVSSTTSIPAEEKAPETAAQDTRIVQPLQGETVTPFSMEELLFNETMGDWRTHDGIDIAAAEGTQVVAAASGEVTAVVDDYWMGTTVTVTCSDGYELRYASLQSSPAVAAGDKVSCGDVIGTVGSTALLEEKTGPHLHFTVLQNGAATDPNSFLAKAE